MKVTELTLKTALLYYLKCLLTPSLGYFTLSMVASKPKLIFTTNVNNNATDKRRTDLYAVDLKHVYIRNMLSLVGTWFYFKRYNKAQENSFLNTKHNATFNTFIFTSVLSAHRVQMRCYQVWIFSVLVESMSKEHHRACKFNKEISDSAEWKITFSFWEPENYLCRRFIFSTLRGRLFYTIFLFRWHRFRFWGDILQVS